VNAKGADGVETDWQFEVFTLRGDFEEKETTQTTHTSSSETLEYDDYDYVVIFNNRLSKILNLSYPTKTTHFLHLSATPQFAHHSRIHTY
jgi:hypothetical protein